MKWFARLLAVFALCIAWGELLAGSPSGERKIVLPIPIGHDVKGLRVPFRDDEGKMQFRMDIQWARRLDEQNVEMRSSVIQTYDQETNKPSAKVELKTSVMNMDTNVIEVRDSKELMEGAAMLAQYGAPAAVDSDVD